MGRLIVIGLLAIGATSAATTAVLDAPLVLRNISPSSPLGVYRHVGALPKPGDYMAFEAAGAGFGRITWATGLPMPAISILKPAAAFPGDRVCFDPETETYRINEGAPIALQERHWQGRLLPIWRGCRDLADDEYFAYADLIPNSLDSRFYGPVPRSAVIGAYRPVWIDEHEGQDR